MKAITVQSPANIAFIKYWGQKDNQFILPNNDSFSMNLSNCFTTLKLEVQEDKTVQQLFIKPYTGSNSLQNSYEPHEGESLRKISSFYQRVKNYLGVSNDIGFSIYSYNSFPKKAGIASSASFFSALALAFSQAFEKSLSQKELSILARLSGSGSACRSIPDGFCWWNKGTNSSDSFAESIAPATYWDLVDIVLILSREEKKVGSQEGHKTANSSPFYAYRLQDLSRRLTEIRTAFNHKDFSKLGTLLEEEAISMHSVMMTQQPPLYFWSGKTVEIIKKLIMLREQGTEAYFTIDAGENVHVICEKKSEEKVTSYFRDQIEVQEMIINYPTIGARVI